MLLLPKRQKSRWCINYDLIGKFHSVWWGQLAQFCGDLDLSGLRKGERNFVRHIDQQPSFLHLLASWFQRVACKVWLVWVCPCSYKWKLEDYPWSKESSSTLPGKDESTNTHFWLYIRWSWQLESGFQMMAVQTPLLPFELYRAIPHQELDRHSDIIVS
jgi:hypothetical protein